MNKKKIITALAVALMISSIIGLSKPVYAADGFFGGGNFFSKFIDFVAQKFGLEKTQVQNAAKEFQQQEKAKITPRPTLSPQEIINREKTRLDTLVNQGKITTDQENAILAELKLLREKYPFNTQNNLTPEQRKTQIDNLKNELNTWAQTNKIDPKLIGGVGMMRGEMGGGRNRENGKGMWGPNPTITPNK